jgi:hypothetical protein
MKQILYKYHLKENSVNNNLFFIIENIWLKTGVLIEICTKFKKYFAKKKLKTLF